MSRRLWGHMIAVILAQRAQQARRPVRGAVRGAARGAACGAALRRRERPRHLQGRVGDYTVPRPGYWCAGCGQSQTPLDEEVVLLSDAVDNSGRSP